MMYFLAGVPRPAVTPETLREKGLHPDYADNFPRLVLVDVIGRGPSGSSGVLVSFDVVTGYFPARQTWHDFGDVWVGWEITPTPETLQRPHQINGYSYTLGDGNAWECPILREGGVRLNLPTTWSLNSRGVFQIKTHPAYQNEIDLAEKIWSCCFGDVDCTTAEAFQMCCQLLAVNYLVCPRAVSALGLLDSLNYARVFKAAIDGPAVQDLLDKEHATVAAMVGLDDQKKSTGADNDI